MRKTTRRFILLLCPLAIILFNYFNAVYWYSSSKRYNAEWDDWAIGLKTGKNTLMNRVPVQMATFLSDVRNLVIFGDEDAEFGKLKMINIIKESSYAKNLDEVRKLPSKDQPKNPEKEIIPDKSSKGWIMDAHKNLPALKYLIKHYPNAEWYLLIDDDTYVFKQNLKNYLSTLNSSENHYIGVPYTFSGCEVREDVKSPSFAQGMKQYFEMIGGAGIIISKAALKKMEPAIEVCNHVYRDCIFGDVRTALCFRDVGINLTHHYGFNAFPPSLHNTDSPCFQPFTFHHMLPFHFKEMHALDGNNVTMEQIFHYYAKNSEEVHKMGEIEIDSDRKGQDYLTMYNVHSPQQCYNLCRGDKKCSAFTHISPICWLKHGIPGITKLTGSYSGAFPERFICRKNLTLFE